jgi:hypothetical protein
MRIQWVTSNRVDVCWLNVLQLVIGVGGRARVWEGHNDMARLLQGDFGIKNLGTVSEE